MGVSLLLSLVAGLLGLLTKHSEHIASLQKDEAYLVNQGYASFVVSRRLEDLKFLFKHAYPCITTSKETAKTTVNLLCSQDLGRKLGKAVQLKEGFVLKGTTISGGSRHHPHQQQQFRTHYDFGKVQASILRITANKTSGAPSYSRWSSSQPHQIIKALSIAELGISASVKSSSTVRTYQNSKSRVTMSPGFSSQWNSSPPAWSTYTFPRASLHYQSHTSYTYCAGHPANFGAVIGIGGIFLLASVVLAATSSGSDLETAACTFGFLASGAFLAEVIMNYLDSRKQDTQSRSENPANTQTATESQPLNK